MRENEFRKVFIKNCTSHYFDNITKIDDFDFYILMDKKKHLNILIYDSSIQIWSIRTSPAGVFLGLGVLGYFRLKDKTRNIC